MATSGNSGTVGEDEEEGDDEDEGEGVVEPELASTVPLTSLWVIGSEVSSGAGWSASVLVTVKEECPTLVTVNFRVAMVPLPLKALAGLFEVTARWYSPASWEAVS